MNRKTKANYFDFGIDFTTDEEINTNQLRNAYKLSSDVCKSKSNKNCVHNIRCLNGLGEKSWLSLSDKTINDLNDSELGRRISGSFVGLKNLGATCYVNCLLQVWFHNPLFRSMIYQWKPEEDNEEIEYRTQLMSSCDKDFVAVSCIGKLQLIFALMQFGIRSSVDPKPIIKCLELDENRQQDAHEFSNLFFTLIENKLKSQRNPKIVDIIQSQYCGQIAYITRCQTCDEGSAKESRFYELDLNIKGFKDINESLSEYLKHESLEGLNQYYCGNCRQKQNAVRYIELRKLPPILNIQLLRFVFDPHIKKLNSFIRFPDVLDIKPFINFGDHLSPEETTYHLSAVLIHRGPSAHSGHYIAHIKDDNNGFWFKFNDEKVEAIEGKKLKLDSDDGIEDITETNGTSERIKDKGKGYHQSNNAYMLVYKNERQPKLNLPNNYKDWDLPEYLINAIEKDNQLFEESIAELIKQKEEENMAYIKRRTEINVIYDQLVALPDQPFEFISKKWLTHWLSAKPSEVINPINNNDLLCLHSKLNFKSLSSVKCISQNGANVLYDTHGGGPRLSEDSMCKRCVQKQVDLHKISLEIDNDIKTITSQMKYTLNPSEECFWVGKESLKSWKRLKLKSIECKNLGINDNSDDSIEMIENNEKEFEISNLNDDIICAHGQLTSDESKRRLIGATVWQTLKRHFPEAREFTQNSSVCVNCVTLNNEIELQKTKYKEMAVIQKTALPNLSAERHRPVWDDLSVTTKYYALNRKFLNVWKKFIIDPSKHSPPEVIENSDLLCAHQMFLYPTDSEISTDSKFVIVLKEEWEALNGFYSFDTQIVFQVILDENNTKSIESDPPFCESCHQSLRIQEQRDRLTYRNESVYVRKTENNASDSDDSNHRQDINTNSYQTKLKLNGKKLRIEETNSVLGNDREIQGLGLRRSRRRRKNKNEKEIKVSSNNTLLDLKIQIMNLFRVPPYDQHLSIDNRPLTSNDMTLADLRVEPLAIITLKVDEEPSGDCTLADDDYIKGAVPEIGFKGTQLQHH